MPGRRKRAVPFARPKTPSRQEMVRANGPAPFGVATRSLRASCQSSLCGVPRALSGAPSCAQLQWNRPRSRQTRRQRPSLEVVGRARGKSPITDSSPGWARRSGENCLAIEDGSFAWKPALGSARPRLVQAGSKEPVWSPGGSTDSLPTRAYSRSPTASRASVGSRYVRTRITLPFLKETTYAAGDSASTPLTFPRTRR